MAGKIQFFQHIQKLYGIVGIRPLKTRNSPFASYNWRNLTLLFLFLMMSLASVAYFLFEACTFTEYSASYFASTAVLIHSACLSSIVPKMADIFTLMEKFGEFVEKSE